VPTLEGDIKLTIPAGTPSGKVFRLRGKGVPVLGSGRRGDQHVRVQVAVPKKVSEKKKKLLQELRELEEKEGPDKSRGILERVKEMFS
jgi:molecular chaperone DnaJ